MNGLRSCYKTKVHLTYTYKTMYYKMIPNRNLKNLETSKEIYRFFLNFCYLFGLELWSLIKHINFIFQYLEDERIALMLQNEEFMAELQKDSEFMSALEMEEERAFYDQQLHQKVWKTCCYTLFIRLRSFLKGHYLSIKVKKFWDDEIYEHFLSLLNKL